MVVAGCLEGRRVSSLLSLQLETGSRKDRTTQRWRYSRFLRDIVCMRMDEAQLSGHKLSSGVRHCSLDCGGLPHL